LGLLLLGFLLWRIDLAQLGSVLRQAAPGLVIAAVILNLPQIALKALRWRGLLRAHGIEYGAASSVLSYFGSIFIGLLTPGRLGEFVKAWHVKKDCGIPAARAFSSVLVDRLFDLYALLLFGGAALLSTVHSQRSVWMLLESAAVLILPLLTLIHDGAFAFCERLAKRPGKWTAKLVQPESWLMELRAYLKSLQPGVVIVSILMTAAAYFLFFFQCYLLAVSLDLGIGPLPVSFAVALGSLVTLLPVSISGLGTREAAMMAYLATAGVAPEKSLGYSLLVFITFYGAGGLMGAVAWLIKPVSLEEARAARS
jgi:uncharacterized protein (TIRG00374 family)